MAVGALAALVALGLPYLSVREVSIASDLTASNPAGALQALDTAARLNPLSADPGRVAGTIALHNGLYAVAEQRFAQAIARDPGGLVCLVRGRPGRLGAPPAPPGRG